MTVDRDDGTSVMVAWHWEDHLVVRRACDAGSRLPKA